MEEVSLVYEKELAGILNAQRKIFGCKAYGIGVVLNVGE